MRKLLLLSSLLVMSTAICAQTITTKTSALQKLKQSIGQLKTSLTSAHHQQATLQQQLKTNETAAGNLAIELKHSQHKLSQQQQLLRQLGYDNTDYRRQLATQQQDLIVQIRATYMLGTQTYLKLLLNHQDPNQLGRTFVYYDYLQKARLQTIAAIEYTLKQIQKNKRNTKHQTQKLLVLQRQQQQEYTKLTASKKRRQQLLLQINRDIKTKQQKLNQAITNQKALEKVITQLKIIEASTTFATPPGKLHKKLSWPTKGKLDNLYGQHLGHSQLTWNGVIINAPAGRDVYAIAPGKVIFAQWLQGYGLLLIIDHGHGYMSLYGRNNSLYKKVGAFVNTGDLIATVGNSGGYDEAGLYFAIRYNGKPVNPSAWCV